MSERKQAMSGAERTARCRKKKVAGAVEVRVYLPASIMSFLESKACRDYNARFVRGRPVMSDAVAAVVRNAVESDPAFRDYLAREVKR